MMHSVKRGRARPEEYNKHKYYLRKIKTNSLYCPRYEYFCTYSVCFH